MVTRKTSDAVDRMMSPYVTIMRYKNYISTPKRQLMLLIVRQTLFATAVSVLLLFGGRLRIFFINITDIYIYVDHLVYNVRGQDPNHSQTQQVHNEEGLLVGSRK